MPDEFTVGGAECNDGSEIEIVAAAGTAKIAVPGSSVAGAGVDQIKFGVVDDRIPGSAASAGNPILAMPSLGGFLQCFGFESARRIAGYSEGSPD